MYGELAQSSGALIDQRTLETPTQAPDWISRFGDIIAALMVCQVRAIHSIGTDHRHPTTDAAISVQLRIHPKIGPNISDRWAVRCVPLGTGSCWTAGVFWNFEDAEVFAQFWRCYVYTEVKTIKVPVGIDAWTHAPMDNWEDLYIRRVSRVSRRGVLNVR